MVRVDQIQRTAGENQPLLTDELGEFENNRLRFKTSGKLPIISKEFREYASN